MNEAIGQADFAVSSGIVGAGMQAHLLRPELRQRGTGETPGAKPSPCLACHPLE